MAPSEIEQAFHGYDQGHRLLASSISLSPQEAALLDRLSDLSGFLPLDTEIPTYLTLYPCGRFYAVARTWPDRSGVRSGTVLTHTLLIPSRDLAAWEALDTLWTLHRVPHGVDDRSPYEQSLTAPLPSSLKWESPRDDVAFSTVAGLLLGRAERPAVVIAAVS